MCGLFGSITKKDVVLTEEQQIKKQNIIVGLALAMQDRGIDSSGIAGIVNDDVVVVKEAVTARKLIEKEEFKELLTSNPSIILGHTRFATIGAVNDKNSHPFEIGNIVGCHNGHVSNYATAYPTGEVDSEAIFHVLNEKNNDYKKAFKELEGKFAITWIDLTDKNKVFLVTEGNPLSILRVKSLNTYFWCSTFYALQSVIGSVVGVDDQAIWSPKESYVYTIGTDFSTQKKKVKFKETSGVSYYRGGYLVDNDEEDDDMSAYGEQQKSLMSGEEAQDEVRRIIGKDKDKAMSYPQYYYKATQYFDDVEMEAIRELTEDGTCLMCDNPLDIEIETGFWWHDIEQAIICDDCMVDLQDYQSAWFIDEDQYIEIMASLVEKEEETQQPMFERKI